MEALLGSENRIGLPVEVKCPLGPELMRLRFLNQFLFIGKGGLAGMPDD